MSPRLHLLRGTATNGLKFRYRPVDEVIQEMDNCGSRMISINDADFFGTPERPKEVMRALKAVVPLASWRHIQACAGQPHVELAAESGCTMLNRFLSSSRGRH